MWLKIRSRIDRIFQKTVFAYDSSWKEKWRAEVNPATFGSKKSSSSYEVKEEYNTLVKKILSQIYHYDEQQKVLHLVIVTLTKIQIPSTHPQDSSETLLKSSDSIEFWHQYLKTKTSGFRNSETHIPYTRDSNVLQRNVTHRRVKVSEGEPVARTTSQKPIGAIELRESEKDIYEGDNVILECSLPVDEEMYAFLLFEFFFFFFRSFFLFSTCSKCPECNVRKYEVRLTSVFLHQAPSLVVNSYFIYLVFGSDYQFEWK